MRYGDMKKKVEKYELYVVGGILISGIVIYWFGVKNILGIIGICFLIFCLSFSFFTSDSFFQWWFWERDVASTDQGRDFLLKGDYLQAIIKFSEVLVSKNSSSAHLGMAWALDKLGENEWACSEYGSAYISSMRNKENGERLIEMAEFYIDALLRRKANDGVEIALKTYEQVMFIVEMKYPASYIIKMHIAILFLEQGNLSEAKSLFLEISKDAPQEELKKFASIGCSLAKEERKYSNIFKPRDFLKWIN